MLKKLGIIVIVIIIIITSISILINFINHNKVDYPKQLTPPGMWIAEPSGV